MTLPGGIVVGRYRPAMVSPQPSTPAVVQAAQGRHEAIQATASFFSSAHLPVDLASVAQIFEGAATSFLQKVQVNHPEVTKALDNLLAAKDAAVRAYGVQTGTIASPQPPTRP